MIIKEITKKKAAASSVRRLIDYLQNDQGKLSRVGTIKLHNLESYTATTAAMEMQALQNMNTRSKNDKTFHFVISFKQGERPSQEILDQIEEATIKKLGFENHQRISIQHDDTDNFHIHVVVNKINAKGKIIEPYYSKFKLQEIAQECEVKFGLGQDHHRTYSDYCNEQRDIEAKTGEETLQGYLRDRKDKLKSAKNWNEFIKTLNSMGIEIQNRGNGFVFTDGNIHVKASKIDRAFSKASLEKLFGEFTPEIAKTSDLSVKQESYESKPKNLANEQEKQLWEKFSKQREEFNYFELRNQKFKERKTQSESIKSFASWECNIINRSCLPPLLKMLIIRLIRRNALEKQKKLKAKMEQELREQRLKNTNWNYFLRDQVAKGNNVATNLLQKRNLKEQERILANLIDQRLSQMFKCDTVTGNGMKIYKTKDSYIKIGKGKVFVKTKTKGLTSKNLFSALDNLKELQQLKNHELHPIYDLLKQYSHILNEDYKTQRKIITRNRKELNINRYTDFENMAKNYKNGQSQDHNFDQNNKKQNRGRKY